MNGNVDLTPYVPSLVFDWQHEHAGVRAREIEGTLVFIDLSGFTAMSERLSKLGRRGAEDVVEIISSTFSELLAVAYQMGGTLLKFGGDALLLFYTGPDHERRGCAAAHGMRRMLRKVGTIRTEAGIVRLGMSSGIHSGVFHMFLVGGSHLELVVAGPATSTCVDMEHTAERGEILISPATAAAIGERYLADPKGPGILLRSAPPVRDVRAAGPIDTHGIDPSVFVPRAIRLRRASGEFEAEHRQCSVAFVRFEGIDRMIEEEKLDAVGDRMNEFMIEVQQILDEHELCFITADVDADSSKLMLVAGAPQAHEDGEERMLRALCSISRLPHFPLRTGVNGGPTFAGDVGPPYRRSYSVMGDTVNTAARVMMRADPGMFLATEPVLARSALRFETTELPPFGAKGKKRPLIAFHVGNALGTTTRDSATTELIGREQDFAALAAAIADAQAGLAMLVEVSGETGIGKSRLVEEVLRHAQGPSHLVRCDRYLSRTAFSASAALLRPLLGLGGADDESALRAVIDEVAPELEPKLPLIGAATGIAVPATPELEQLDQRLWTLQLHDTVSRLLDALLEGPALVVFEDAQWMDDASFALLRGVAQRRIHSPWAAVLVRRPGAPAVPEATTIELGPLDDEASVRLARVAASRPLLPVEASSLAERARGNPLFLRELAQSFDPDAGVDALPGSLEATIAARIDALPPFERMVLRHVSVLGESFDASAVAAVVEADGDPTSLLRGLGDFIDAGPDGFRFRQVLFHDVAYAHLPFRLRTRLHQRAGEHIERASDEPERQAAVLSAHFHEGRDPARSWRYSRAAADAAFSAHAYAAAVHYYRRAVTAARGLGAVDDGDLVAVWRSLGDSLRYTGRLAEATGAYAAGRRLAESRPGDMARLCLLEGDIRRRLGRPAAEAVRWYRRGLRALEGRELMPEERVNLVRIHLAIGHVRYEQGKYTECERWFRSSLEGAERNGDVAGMGLACHWLHHTAVRLRDPEGQAYGRRALELFEQAGLRHMEAQVLSGLAESARAFGRWQEAIDLIARSRRTLEELGDSLNAAALASNGAEILSDQGRYAEARALFEEALAAFVAAGHAWMYAVKSNLARLALREGSTAQAAELFGEARGGLLRAGATSLVTEVDIRMAEQALLEGRPLDALAGLEAVDTSGEPTLQPIAARIRGCALMALGDAAGARASLREALTVARSLQDDYETALCLSAYAVCDLTPEEQGAAAGEASEIFSRLGVIAVALLPPGRLAA